MKKVYKYATGKIIPDGSTYLSTIVEEYHEREQANEEGTAILVRTLLHVWHYFLVDEDENDNCKKI